MSKRAVKSGGSSLACSEDGSGHPVVLLHGLTATRHYVVMGSTWLERNGCRVIAYDARGHGESEPASSSGGYEYSNLVEDLRAVMDSFEIERATLAGASMGAHTAIAFALAYPERVEKLVIATPAFDPERHESKSESDEWHALAQGLRNRGADGFMRAYQSRSAEQFRDVILTATEQRLSRHLYPEAVADAIDVVPYSRPFESWEALATLECPVTVLASRDEADPTHPFATAQRYHQSIQGSTFAVEEKGESPIAWRGAQFSRLIIPSQ